MNRPDLKKADKSTLDYIEYLEGCLNGVDELSLALQYATHILAGDIYKLCDGTGIEMKETDEGVEYINHLSILKGSPKDKTFDQLMDVFTNFGSKIMAVNKNNKPQAQEKGKIGVKPGGNPFEHVITEVKRNGNPRI